MAEVKCFVSRLFGGELRVRTSRIKCGPHPYGCSGPCYTFCARDTPPLYRVYLANRLLFSSLMRTSVSVPLLRTRGASFRPRTRIIIPHYGCLPRCLRACVVGRHPSDAYPCRSEEKASSCGTEELRHGTRECVCGIGVFRGVHMSNPIHVLLSTDPSATYLLAGAAGRRSSHHTVTLVGQRGYKALS